MKRVDIGLGDSFIGLDSAAYLPFGKSSRQSSKRAVKELLCRKIVKHVYLKKLTF